MAVFEPEPNSPCWVELGTLDVPTQSDFYARTFGWDMTADPRPGAAEYMTASFQGRAVAGISPPHDRQPQGWNVSFRVRDIDAAIDVIKDSGGSLVRGPHDVLDKGRSAVVTDPAGAGFRLWQAGTFAGFELMDAPGSLFRVDLYTRDVAAAAGFYGGVLGWQAHEGDGYWVLGLGDRIIGGIYDQSADEDHPQDAPAFWIPYFLTADIHDTVARAAEAGGEAADPQPVGSGVLASIVAGPGGSYSYLVQLPDEGL